MLRFYREFCATLPDEAEAYGGLLTDPEAGIPIVGPAARLHGPLDEGERVLRAGPGVRPAARRPVGPMPYCARQTLLDEPRRPRPPPLLEVGVHRAARRRLIDGVVEAAAAFTSPLSACCSSTSTAPPRACRSATRVRRPPAAVGLRHHRPVGRRRRVRPAHLLGQVGLGPLRAAPKGSAYINHISADDAPEKVRASYGANHERLRILKGKYDPTNLFRNNPNIQPG